MTFNEMKSKTPFAECVVCTQDEGAFFALEGELTISSNH